MDMRRVRYAVAMSLDGYLAGPKGETDWISIDPEVDFGSLLRQFDTLLAGRVTFEAMAQAGRTSMAGMRTVVFSRTLKAEDHPDVTLVSNGHREFLMELKASAGKDIWLFGGGSLFRSLAEAGLVDTVEVSVIPVLLGGGVPLSPGIASRMELSLTGHRIYRTGRLTLEYAVLPRRE